MIAATALLVAACSTNVHVRQEVADEVKGNLAIQEVLVSNGRYANAQPILMAAIEEEVRKRLSTMNAIGDGNRLDLIVEKSKMVSAGSRALFGAFAGSSEIELTAKISDMKSGKLLGEFMVVGSYNPGGWGMFSDPNRSAANAVADALAEKLGGN